MIYIKSFKNYDEFKQLFGIVEHGNGAKSRKNKILLACLKNRKLLKWWLGFKKQAFEHGASVEAVEYNDYLRAANMDELKRFAKLMLNDAIKDSALWNKTDDAGFKIEFAEDFCYGLYSPTLKIDKFHGLCVDGDSRSIRYVNTERANKVFKMKAGKFISKCIEDNRVTREFMPEQMKRWIGEEFAREWQSYAEQNIGEDRYILYVDDNFSDIYDSDECDGDFGSCMTDKDYYSFYEDAINCKAAYLRDAESNLIVARCIVYQDVHDENGNSYRLAERQYARDQDDVLKQMLVDMLIKAGEIDGYKRVGADCHDNRNFVFNNGESMRELDLCIDCRLDYGLCTTTTITAWRTTTIIVTTTATSSTPRTECFELMTVGGLSGTIAISARTKVCSMIITRITSIQVKPPTQSTMVRKSESAMTVCTRATDGVGLTKRTLSSTKTRLIMSSERMITSQDPMSLRTSTRSGSLRKTACGQRITASISLRTIPYGVPSLAPTSLRTGQRNVLAAESGILTITKTRYIPKSRTSVIAAMIA